MLISNPRETIATKERLAKSVRDAMRAMARTEQGVNRRQPEVPTSPTLIVPDLESAEVKTEGSSNNHWRDDNDDEDECVIVHEVLTRSSAAEEDHSGQTVDMEVGGAGHILHASPSSDSEAYVPTCGEEEQAVDNEEEEESAPVNEPGNAPSKTANASSDRENDGAVNEPANAPSDRENDVAGMDNAHSAPVLTEDDETSGRVATAVVNETENVSGQRSPAPIGIPQVLRLRRRSPPVLSLGSRSPPAAPPVLHLRGSGADDSPRRAVASNRYVDESSDPGEDDTTVELSSGEAESQGHSTGKGVPGGHRRIRPTSNRARSSHQFCWLCQRRVHNALMTAHYENHLTRSGHAQCPVCDNMYNRGLSWINRHARHHFLPYAYRCNRCGTEGKTRVSILFCY